MASIDQPLVEARWIGTCESTLIDSTVLIPGETVVEIGVDEALASANWEVLATVTDLRKAGKKLGVDIPSGLDKVEVEQAVAKARATKAEEESEVPDTASEEPAEADQEGDS